MLDVQSNFIALLTSTKYEDAFMHHLNSDVVSKTRGQMAFKNTQQFVLLSIIDHLSSLHCTKLFKEYVYENIK